MRLQSEKDRTASEVSKLPENLKSLRKAKGWTQQALADRLGLTRPTLGAYEEGRSEPKLSVLIDMAACFGTTVDALVRGIARVRKIFG